MHAIEDLIEQARQMPRQDQRRLLKELEYLLDQESDTNEPRIPQALYSRSLELLDTLASNLTDVSADKYKHLAEAYAQKDSNG